MFRNRIVPFLALLIAACTTTHTSQPPVQPQAITTLAVPVTEARPVSEMMQGVTITDPYRWLEDQNSPDTRAWIDRENTYTDTMLNSLPDKQRFTQRIQSL